MHWALAGGLWTGGVLGFVVALLARLLRYRNGDRSEEHEFSQERYWPMTRLLAAEDFDFLATQPGCRPEIALRFRRSRRRVFHLYLCELADDFHRLHARARKMVAESGEEQSGLGGPLMRRQVAFWRTMITIEFRMMTPGLAGGIEVRPLVLGIEAMRADLARMTVPIAA